MTATLSATRRFTAMCRVPLLRTIQEFAEQDIVVPDGPRGGLKYRCATQPYTRPLFDEMMRDRWQRIVILGVQQSGKTLSGFVIPTLYHLFERNEKVICGVPHLDMAADKWREDLLPVIENSKWRDLLPAKGPGSRGGKNVTAIKFRNGATLRFMSGSGDDKSRSGYTARVVVITETDGMDTASETSREADPISQLEGRTRADWARRRIYMECTVSTPEGRTWREYQSSTKSRLVIPCPHCSAWVTPEREHLKGWKDAEDYESAEESGRLHCPECDQPWDESQRKEINQRAMLVHDGQEVTPDGQIVGPEPRTNTLGFRWNAANNSFIPMGTLAADEWKDQYAEDTDSAEKEKHQFVWAIPWAPPELNLRILTANHVQTKLSGLDRRQVPEWATGLTLTIDVGAYYAHWLVKAWKADATSTVIDYGVIEIYSGSTGDERAIEHATLVGLLDFWDALEADPFIGPDGKPMQVSGLCDSGYAVSQLAVYEFCRQINQRTKRRAMWPAKGYGQVAKERSRYASPKNRTCEWHPSQVEGGLTLVHFNADHWKLWAHERWHTAIGTPGASSIFGSTASPEQRESARRENMQFAKHITNEEYREEEVPGKGKVGKWHKKSRNNHWLDCDAMAGVAANGFYGVQVVATVRQEIKPIHKPSPLTMPDGRPFLITERN